MIRTCRITQVNDTKEVKEMFEVINKYEMLYIINNALPEEEISALVEKFKSLIARKRKFY